MRRPLLAALSLLLLSACDGEPAATAEKPCGGAEGIAASDAWIRAAGEGRNTTAAYVTLCNGGVEDRLVGARFDGAAMVELHASITGDDGRVSMAPLEGGLVLPAGGVAELAPGGAHLMVMGLSAPVGEGDAPSITLEFENAPPLTVTFETLGPTEAAAREHEGH